MAYGLVSLDLHLRGPQAHSYTNDKDYLARCSPAPSAVLLCHTKSHTIFLCLAIHTLNHTQPPGIMWISVSCPKTLWHSARDQTNHSLISKLKANAYTFAIGLPACAKFTFFSMLLQLLTNSTALLRTAETFNSFSEYPTEHELYLWILCFEESTL